MPSEVMHQAEGQYIEYCSKIDNLIDDCSGDMYRQASASYEDFLSQL